LDQTKRRPGEVRDAILSVLTARPAGAPLHTIEQQVADLIGHAARSSVRSYLRLNTPATFIRTARGYYGLKVTTRVRVNKAAESRLDYWRSFSFGKSLVLEADCLNWLREQQPNTIHAVVTDPPYGLFEYSS
jgi:site-specific DNA-methyltransferase (adenine-specific)